MYYLSCVFDRQKYPLFAVSFNSDDKSVEFYQLYLKGTKYPLCEVKKNEEKIRKIFYEDDVVLSGFKPYIQGFNLNLMRRYEVFDVNLVRKENIELNVSSIKKHLLKEVTTLIKTKQNQWQQILANSQLVYRHFEHNGHYYNGRREYPEYDLTFTGRSKCLVSNIQGAGQNEQIHHIKDEYDMFVHFDWIAADFRVASLFSKDKYLLNSFRTSDPYTTLYDELGSEEISRDQCKLELFRSLYSMSSGSNLLKFYPEFVNWIDQSALKIENNGYSTSLIGRRFYMGPDRPIRSVFNAQIQGSVAHAMQNVLYRVFKMFPDNILTEIFDSLVLCCKQEDLKTIIPEVSNIMLYPFEDLLESNPNFPLKVSVGMDWKQWKLYKEYR